jgi:hypothetical protein
MCLGKKYSTRRISKVEKNSPLVKNRSRAVVSRLPRFIVNDAVVGLRKSALGDGGEVPANGVGAYKKKVLTPIGEMIHLCVNMINIISVQGSWEGFDSLCSSRCVGDRGDVGGS